jgi:hypothetical protein
MSKRTVGSADIYITTLKKTVSETKLNRSDALREIIKLEVVKLYSLNSCIIPFTMDL